jgi:hypothetical protein
MAIHTELPIHKTAYDLMGVVVQAARNMPRDVKLLVGGKIRDELLEAFDSIYLANRAQDKVPHIDSVQRHILRAELLLRMSRDMRYISTSVYAEAVQRTQSIGKQATAWRKHYAPQSPVASPSRR